MIAQPYLQVAAVQRVSPLQARLAKLQGPQFVVIWEFAGRGEQAGGLNSPRSSLQVWLAGLLTMGV